ncbi:MAG TPA: N-acetyltransferase [Alphaproteobacteria bacterium]|nr:N-acetyltransferase [Alphaproteobacteria bacterium]
MEPTIEPAVLEDATELASMVGELLGEIMERIAEPAFQFDVQATEQRLRDYLRGDAPYTVHVARAADGLCGFVGLCEAHALYAGGAYGTVTELYVRPAHRGEGVGRRLLDAVLAYGAARGWTRLEVTTPPLPAFDATLRFYQREGFAITGGRKLKRLL